MFNFNHGHEPFYAVQRALLTVIKWCLNLLVFSPLVIVAYFTATHLLHRNAHGLLWVAVLLLLSTLYWWLIQWLKKLMVVYRARRNRLWLVLFISLLLFTITLPAYLAYTPICSIVLLLHGTPVISILIELAFICYIYYRHNFFNRH